MNRLFKCILVVAALALALAAAASAASTVGIQFVIHSVLLWIANKNNIVAVCDERGFY